MMLRCVLCDDDKAAGDTVRGFLKEYAVQLDCSVFCDPFTLLAAVRSGQKYDIYILDIVMPAMTGIELAREIRKADCSCVIIFITSSDDFHKEAYGVDALSYIEKPPQKAEFFRALDRTLRYLGEKSDAVLPIETKSGIAAIHINQIVYVESFRHVLNFHMSDGSTVETRNSSLPLKELTESLRFPPFYMPYRGFIVNLDSVSCLGKLQLTMLTGAVIPIPQKQFSKVRQQYSDYVLTRYAGDRKC
jgi:DNA-binding LytR/AlgR family response regulator